MIKLSVFIFLFLFTSLSFGQEPSFDIHKNEFGAHVGATTGIGLSYRHWFNKAGIQITAIPIKTDEVTFSSMGLTALYSLKKTKYIRAYLYLGNHLLFTNENNSEYDNDGNYIGESEGYTKQYNIGFGPGFSFGRIVAFNIMFGYGMYDVTDRFNLFPTGEMGVYYMF